MQKLYSDFELQGVTEDKLNSKTYQNIAVRMNGEEAACALTMSARGVDTESVFSVIKNWCFFFFNSII